MKTYIRSYNIVIIRVWKLNDKIEEREDEVYENSDKIVQPNMKYRKIGLR